MSSLKKGYVLAKNCPSRKILQHITSRWGGLVMFVLLDGTKRFSEIRREVEGISERMLSETLKNLEQDGMLIRHSYNTVPPHTDYTLTDCGRQIGEKIRDLVNCLQDNFSELVVSQPKEKA